MILKVFCFVALSAPSWLLGESHDTGPKPCTSWQGPEQCAGAWRVSGRRMSQTVCLSHETKG